MPLQLETESVSSLIQSKPKWVRIVGYIYRYCFLIMIGFWPILFILFIFSQTAANSFANQVSYAFFGLMMLTWFSLFIAELTGTSKKNNDNFTRNDLLIMFAPLILTAADLLCVILYLYVSRS